MKFFCLVLILCFGSIKCQTSLNELMESLTSGNSNLTGDDILHTIFDGIDKKDADSEIDSTVKLIIAAMKIDDVQRFYEIMQDRDINKSFENLTFPLHYSIEYGAKKIFDDLIEKGADVNAADDYGETPLHYAALNPNEYFVDTLIKKGADVNKKDMNENTPLHNSAINTNLKVIELLLANGANISAVNKYGETALHLAAYNKNEKIVELLIEKGIDIHAKCCANRENDFAKTALFNAMLNSNEKVAESLINGGANVNEVSKNYGHTPIIIVSMNGMKVDVRFSWFRNHFSKKLEELRNEHAKHPIHENVMEKLVELLTKNGADINNEVAGLGTPLAFAVRQGNTQFKEALLKHGAKSN